MKHGWRTEVVRIWNSLVVPAGCSEIAVLPEATGRATHGLTRSSIKVPLSSLTLFLPDERTEPWAAFGAAARVTFSIPRTP